MLDMLNMLDILNVSYMCIIFKINSIKMNILMHEELPMDLSKYYCWWVMCALTLPTNWNWWALPMDWSWWVLPTN